MEALSQPKRRKQVTIILDDYTAGEALRTGVRIGPLRCGLVNMRSRAIYCGTKWPQGDVQLAAPGANARHVLEPPGRAPACVADEYRPDEA
jgi:hypothetical protein